MLRYVSHGPRPFGAKPFAPIRRPYWEFFAVVAGQLAPVTTLAEKPAEKRRCDALARELMPHVWVDSEFKAILAERVLLDLTLLILPRWVPSGWNDTDERFDNAVLAMSAKYLGGKVVLLGATRYDRYSSKLKSQQEFGDLPADWDATTLLYKPEAPADWATLSYIPRNATTGIATATKPVPAVTRPRQNAPGVVTNNGVQIYNPFFANDRFRNDYHPCLYSRR
jgi:hypothetical protein